jgi:hypothetical protein
MLRSVLVLFSLLTVAPAGAAEERASYDQATILSEAGKALGDASEGIAKVVEKVFSELGEPNAYISGEELGGGFVFGLRYGDGVMRRATGSSVRVFWTGPSLGLDLGGNVARTFVLVYNLDATDDIFQRFPAVEGSFYFVAGAGVNYQQRGQVILAPIRVGAGLRATANIGYIHFTPERSWIPF